MEIILSHLSAHRPLTPPALTAQKQLRECKENLLLHEYISLPTRPVRITGFYIFLESDLIFQGHPYSSSAVNGPAPLPGASAYCIVGKK